MAKHKRSKPIREYLYDKGDMIEQMFSSIPIVEVRNMVPIKLQGMPLHELKAECLVELLEMSDREIMSILDGKKTRDPSSSESDAEARGVVVISDDEKRIKKEKKSDWRPAARKDDSDDSSTEQGTSSKKKNKRKSKEDDDPKGRKKKKVDIRQPVPSSSKEGQSSKEIPKKKKGAKPPEKPKRPAEDVVVLDDISSEESGNEGGNKKTGEKSLLDLLELEMRARAIRSLLKKEEDVQAKKVLSEYKDEPDDLIQVDVLPPQVDLVSDSDEDSKKNEPTVEPSTSSCLQIEVEGDALSSKNSEVLDTLLGIENKETSEVVERIEVDDASVDFVGVSPTGNGDATCKLVGNKSYTALRTTSEVEKSKSGLPPAKETDSHPINDSITDCGVTVKVEKESSNEAKQQSKVENRVAKATPNIVEPLNTTIAKSFANSGTVGVGALEWSALDQKEITGLKNSFSTESPPTPEKEQSDIHVHVCESSVAHQDDNFGETNIAKDDTFMSVELSSFTKDETVIAPNIVGLEESEKNTSTSPKQIKLLSDIRDRSIPRNFDSNQEENDILLSGSEPKGDQLALRNVSDEAMKPSVLSVEGSKPQSASGGDDYHSNFEEDILDYDYDPSLNNPERQSLHSGPTGTSCSHSQPLRGTQSDKSEGPDNEEDCIENIEESDSEQLDKACKTKSHKSEIFGPSQDGHPSDEKLNCNDPIQESNLSLPENNLNTSNSEEKLDSIDNHIVEHCGILVGGSIVETETVHLGEPLLVVEDSILGGGNGPAGSYNSVMLRPNADGELAPEILNNKDSCPMLPIELETSSQKKGGTTLVAENQLSSTDQCFGDQIVYPSEKQHHHFLVVDALGSPEAVSSSSALEGQEQDETDSSKNIHQDKMDDEVASHIDQDHDDKLSSEEGQRMPPDNESLDSSDVDSLKTVTERQELQDYSVEEDVSFCSLDKGGTTQLLEQGASENSIVDKEKLDHHFLVNDALGSLDAVSSKSAIVSQERKEVDLFINIQQTDIDREVHHPVGFSSKEEQQTPSDHESFDESNVGSPKLVAERQGFEDTPYVEEIVDCSSDEEGINHLKQVAVENVLVEKDQLNFLVNDALGSPEAASSSSPMKSQEHCETDSSMNIKRGSIDREATAHIDQDHQDNVSKMRKQSRDHQSPDLSYVESPNIVADRKGLVDPSYAKENIHCSLEEGGSIQLEGAGKNVLVDKELFVSSGDSHSYSDIPNRPFPETEILDEELDDRFPSVQEDHEKVHVEHEAVEKLSNNEEQHYVVDLAIDCSDAEVSKTEEVIQEPNEFSSMDVEDDFLRTGITEVHKKNINHPSEGKFRGDREPEDTAEKLPNEEDERFLVNEALASLESRTRITNQELLCSKVAEEIVVLEDEDGNIPEETRPENSLKRIENPDVCVHVALSSSKTSVVDQGQDAHPVTEKEIQPSSDCETTAFVGCNSIETQKKIQITDGQAVRQTVIFDGASEASTNQEFSSLMEYVIISSEDEDELGEVTSHKEQLDESIDCSFEIKAGLTDQLSLSCNAPQISYHCESQKYSIHQDSPVNPTGDISCSVIISSDEQATLATESLKRTSSGPGDSRPGFSSLYTTKALSLEPTLEKRHGALGNRNGNSEVDEINQNRTECLEENTLLHGVPRVLSVLPSPTKLKPSLSSLIMEAKTNELGTGNNNSDVFENDEVDLVDSSNEEEQTYHGADCFEEMCPCPSSAIFSTIKVSSLEPSQPASIVEVRTGELGNGSNNSEVIEIGDEDSGDSRSEEEQTSNGTKFLEETTSGQGEDCFLSAPSSTTKASSLEQIQTSSSVGAITHVLENENNNSEVIEIDEDVSSDTSSEEEQSSDDSSEDSSQSDEGSLAVHSISDEEVSVGTQMNQNVLSSSDKVEVEVKCITGEMTEKSKQSAKQQNKQSVKHSEVLSFSKGLLTGATITAQEKIIGDVIDISDSEGGDGSQPDSIVKPPTACCDKTFESVTSSNKEQEITAVCPSTLPSNLNSEFNSVSCNNDLHSLQTVNVHSSDSNGRIGNNIVDQTSKEPAALEKDLEEGEIEDNDSIVEISEEEGFQNLIALNHSDTSYALRNRRLRSSKQRCMTSTESDQSVDSLCRRRDNIRAKLRKKRRTVKRGSTRRINDESKDQQSHLPEPLPRESSTVTVNEGQVTSNISKLTLDCNTIVVIDDDEKIVQAITEQMPPEILDLDDSDEAKTNWTARWLESSHVKKVVTTSKILMNARKKLKMKLKEKEVPEIEAVTPIVEVPKLIGSVEEYHRLVKEGVITSSSKPDDAKKSVEEKCLEKVVTSENSEVTTAFAVAPVATTTMSSDANFDRGKSSKEIPVNILVDPVISVDQPCGKPAALEKELLEEGEIEESDNAVDMSSSDPVLNVALQNRPKTQTILNVEYSNGIVTRHDEVVAKGCVSLNESNESNVKGAPAGEDDGECRDGLSVATGGECETKAGVCDPQPQVSETSNAVEIGSKSFDPVPMDLLSSSIKSFYEMMNPNLVIGIDLSSESLSHIPIPPLVSDRNERECNSSGSIQPPTSSSALCPTSTRSAEFDDIRVANQSFGSPHIILGTTEKNTSAALESNKNVSATSGMVSQLSAQNDLEEGEIEDSEDEVSRATSAVEIRNTVRVFNNNVVATSSPIVQHSAAISSTPSVGNTSLQNPAVRIVAQPGGPPSTQCTSTYISHIAPASNVGLPNQLIPTPAVQHIAGHTNASSLPCLLSSSSQNIIQVPAVVQSAHTTGSSGIVHSTHSVRTVSHSTLSSVIPPSYTIPEGQTTMLMVNSALQNPSVSDIHAAFPPMNPIQAASAEISNLCQYGGSQSGLKNPQMSVNINSTLQMYDPYYSWVYRQGLSGSLTSNYGYGAPDQSHDASTVYKQWGEYYRKLMEACQDSAARASASNMFGPVPADMVDGRGYSWVYERPNQTPAPINNPESSNIVPKEVEPVQIQGPSEEWNYRYGLKGLLNEHFVTPGTTPPNSNPPRGGPARRRPSRRGRRRKKR